MKRSKVLWVMVVAALAGVVRMSGQPADEAAIRSILVQQEAAWNSGDGAAWASVFTEDADFVNIRGDLFHGREEIGQRHALILAGPFKGSHNSVTVRRFTQISPNVALIETDHLVTGFKGLPPGIAPTSDGTLKTHMKYVAVKRAGKWKFVAAQNTVVLPAMAMQK